MSTRQIVLDTETTGLDPQQGHRVIEIGCVELVERRPSRNDFHRYLQPDREIDAAAVEVHGISNDLLRDKPRFGDIYTDLIEYLDGAEVIIHNAPFDVGFIDAELALVGEARRMADFCRITDSLVLARERHPGQRNSLDALCARYDVDNSARTRHGALLDAELLADVYLAMTAGQHSLSLDAWDATESGTTAAVPERVVGDRPRTPVMHATEAELAQHRARLQAIDEASGGRCLWLRTDDG